MINILTGPPWLSAGEAAARLRVTRATLYAYVSRGLLRSQAAPGSSRARLYAAEDVERLRRKAEERRAPDKAAAGALQWGMPILESAIALIDGRHLYYRGLDAADLSRRRSLEEAAAWIWTGRFDAGEAAVPVVRAGEFERTMPFAARTHSLLAREAAADSAALDLRPENVRRAGFRILRLLLAAAIGKDPGGAAADAVLARAWRVDAAGRGVLRAALVLCADHELNVSSFTARCVASAGSHPYAVVTAGLAAMEGPRHGGAGARVLSMLASLDRRASPRHAIADRLRRGEPLDGFGHPLYPDGDPRAHVLFELLRKCGGRSAERRFVERVADAGRLVSGHHPNLDFALAAATRVLRLPPEAPLMLFAIGRSAGWIGHALEQYATGQLIRPRAKYVGVTPAASGRPEA